MPSIIKRSCLSIVQKQEILKRLNHGMTATKLAQHYSVHRSTITRIKKNHEIINDFICQTEVVPAGRKTVKASKFPKMEEALYKWFCNQRAQHATISTSILCEKAKKIHQKIEENNSTFCASSGWLKKFKKRYGIRFLKVVGEKLSNNSDAVDPFVIKFNQKLKDLDVTADQVYNADESGLFWKLLPDKTLVRVNEKSAPGRKVSKERITFLACTNSSGTHKVKLFIIGKAKKPRAFRNFYHSKITYSANKNAWMTSILFQNWLESTFVPEVKQFLESRNLPYKTVLLLDNAPCHPRDTELNINGLHIIIVCFPPNCTALLQPMDQNVINLTKMNYKKSLLAHLVASKDDMHTSIKSINLRHAVTFLANAWDILNETHIRNCWKLLMKPNFDEWDSEDDLPLRELRDRLQNNRTDIGTARENLQTLLGQIPSVDHLSPQEITNWISERNLESKPTESDEESSDNENIIAESTKKPQIKLENAIQSFTICLEWAQQNSASLDDLIVLQRLREGAVLRRNICMKQTTISHFFRAS